MGKQTPFEKFRDSITPMGYVPSQSYAEDVASLQQSDYFLQNFKTPSDIQEYKNYILDTQFRQMGVQSPYESTGDYRARFNPEADINNTLLSGDDTPEQDLFKRISHQIILNRGKLPVASFLEQAVNSSMTAGWAKFLGDNMFDFKGEIPDLHMAEDGIFYKGKRLNLTQEQMNILNDYNAKISGTNKDYSFIEDIAKTATSLVFDAPLLFMTGGISAGAMKLSTVTSALAKSTQYLPRLTGQIIQQGINFNLLGIPQTVESTRQNGLSGMLGSVWHNVTTGSLAAFTGTTGVALGKATGLMFLKNNPAIREEFGGLLGSTGFGYSLGKIEGMSDEDAIAQGLAFAATHFTNPTAYKRVITEMKNRNVRVYAESLANNQDTGMLPDYFIEKDGKYQKIEADAFKREGRIVPMDVEPIEATSSNKMEYLPINSLPDYAQIKFRDALARDRNEKNGQKLYEKWVKDLDPEYVKANADKLRSLAEITSASLVGAKLGEVFGKWKLPADAKLDNQMIKLSKQYSLPYSDVKRFVLENVNEYFISPEDVISRIQENPTVAKDLEGVLKVAGETFVKQAKANYAQELLDRSGIPASRQLTEGTPPKPVDLKTEAERIAEGVRRTNLKKQAVEGVLPATEQKPGKYVFYDFNGELVPMVKEKGKLKIAGTNVEIPFEKVKDKVKTKTEVVKEVKEKASKKTKELEVNKTVEFEADGKKQTGVITTFTDEFKNANIKTEDGKVLNVPVSSLKETEGVKSGKEKTEVLKETQPSETVAEVKPVEPVESVESKPIESTIETKPENKPETTPISTVKETTEPKGNIASTETKPTSEPKKEFEFEKSNLLDVVDKVVSDNNYIISQDGKAKINKTISDIKDYARKMGVPEKDVRDFAILTLKEAGLPNAKIANMMKIGGSAISTDAVKKVVERKSNIYGKQAKELSTRRSAEEQPKTLFEEELASQMGKVNMGRKQEDLSGEDLSGKDVGLASLQQGEVVGEQPREITRVRPETRMKRAEDVVKKVLEKYDLEDRKQYEKALRDVSENAYLEEGGDTEVGIAMLQNAKLGRPLRDQELIKPALMFETRTPTKPMSAEELNAGIKDMESRGFIFEEGIIDQTNVPLSKEGKPQVRAGVTFKDSDGNIRTVIDKRFGVPDTIEHESFHQYMLKALGNDRKLVDRVLKDYGWDGKENQTLVDAHEAIIDQLAGRKQLSKPVQFIKETFEKFANWLHGKGFYSEAQLFRKLANGEINVGKPPRVPDLTFYEKVAGDKDAIRYTLKSFDSILDNETLTINDSFWNRLKNKGVKDAEINYLKTFLEDGRQLKGEEFKSAVLEKMFPIQIKEVWETTTPRSGDAERPLRTLLKASQRFSGMTTSGGHNQSDIAQIKQKIADLDKSIAVYKEWKKNKDLQPELGERIEALLNERAGLFSELNSTKAEKYRILSFDIPNQVVKQVHDYWGNRKESVGWARVEDEVVNGNRTGYLNVNEIQGQLQYTNMPKVFEDLKPGDVYKFEGVKYRVVQPLPAYGGFENYRNQYGYVEVQKFEKGKWGSTENITKESYELDKISVGSEPKFLESMQPIMTDLQIKSLIQYAADNGYKGVRFPTMKSITDIEGFEHLTERAESLQREITSWEKIKNNNAIIEDATKVDERLESLYDEYKLGKIPEKEYQVTKNKINEDFIKRWGLDSEEDMGHAIVNAEIVARQVKRAENYNSDVSSVIENELISSRQELEDITTGDTAQKTNAVKKFYEETVGMAGKRLRKENWQKVNDAYGNEWFETKVGAKDTDPIKFYQTIEKPAEGKTDLLEITDSKEYAKFVEWRDKYLVQTSKVVPVDKVDYALKNNKLSTTAKKIGNKIYQMGIQVNNYVNQVDKNGDYIRPTERGLYLIARDKLVTKMPYEINSVLKNPETWNEGHHFRMLDNNNRKDWTNRNDIASKINQYHLDIYYGKKEAPKLMEGETLEQAHTRIGKDIGLTDAQIKADWKTQQAYAQAMNKAYNATVDMYANLKDDMTGDYIVVDGLSRKQLDKVFGTESIKDEVEAYSRAKEIINANPEKRFEVAVELANKSPFAERQNPFYHSDTRPSNPNFWLVKGKKPTGELKDGKIQWDEFFTYAENEKEANRIAKEWNDKGFAVEEKFNIGKEISDKRYNRLSANQLINLANAGHIPISNETVKALLEATKSGRFEQHSLEKKYVPGMHGTAKEYESQLVNFVNEAMSASVKRYALDEMKDYILKENIMLNQIMKNPATTDIEKTEAKGTSEWMSQFYNQVAQSDRSVVDTLREIATTYYIGFKPSFPFMQMFQPLQMALPEAIKEGGNTGLWAKSLGTAWDLAYEIRARQKGETTGKVEDELFALYDKFDKMNKMGATGIRELTGEAGDIQLHYGSNSYRNWKTFMKFGNMAGAIAEKYTRLQSLAMWYDIAKSKGLSGKAMEDFVLTKHDEVMALWGASGRPVIGQSKEMGTQQQKAIKAFAKSFFTFKTYTMANLGQYDRLMRNRSWGALGTKMAVGVGLHGITKFPLMATFYGLYNLLSDDDLEYEQLKALDEVNAGILGRGISDILPISLQNMFDERTAFVSDAYAETRSKSAEGKLLEAMLGAPYGVPKDMIEGSMAIHKLVMNGIDDDAVLTEDERIRAKKNWSKVLPLAARNVFNAMNMDTDGIQIRGRELVKAEDISWADVVYKVLGFNPSKVANAYELQFSGFPAKWSRINGKIAELKKIRKEIAEEKGYTQLERKTELQNVARLLKEAMSEQSELRKSTDYRSAVKQKLISP